MQHYIELTNTEIITRINERIHSERDRHIMKLRCVDGHTYEKIAEAVCMSPVQITRIVKRCRKLIEK